MALLIVLIAATLLARLVGRFGVPGLRSWTGATRIGLAVMFCFTAAAHFTAMRADLVRMVPPWIPNPELMVSFTGVCEILGAMGLLLRQTRRLAAAALMVFLIAVLPANIHAAETQATIGGAPAAPLVPRIAMQALFIVLLWWSALRVKS